MVHHEPGQKRNFHSWVDMDIYQTDRQTGRQTDRQADRQTDSQINKKEKVSTFRKDSLQNLQGLSIDYGY